jgi:hypothetical protein
MSSRCVTSRPSAIGALALRVTALLGTGVGAMSACAQEPPGDWQFRASAYGYVPDARGDSSLGGASASFEVAAADIVRHTDTGFMGVFEARKERAGAFTDVIALDLASSTSRAQSFAVGGGVSLPPGVTADASLDVRLRAMTLAGEIRVHEAPAASIDVFVGARLLDVTTGLDYAFSNDFGPFRGPARSGSLTAARDSWDAVVGAKGRFAFGPDRRWLVFSYADVGSGDSKLTWQGSLVVGRKVGRFDMAGGWRHVAYDFAADSALHSLTFDGPVLGASIAW